MDHEQFRAESRERWEAAAAGWGARRTAFSAATEPVSRWLVDAIDPRPGHVVLDLAAGTGETGFLAAAAIGPGGRLISTDGAEAMVALAAARAGELGLANVETRVMEAEWIDLTAASVDGVLCRWGYMLLADPEAALRETRRVLRPGGRVALAAWDAPEHNPWLASFDEAMRDLGLAPAADPSAPGPFSFAVPGTIEGLLDAAGFQDAEVGAVDFAFETPTFDDWWELQYDLSPSRAEALAGIAPEQRDEVYETIEERFAVHRGANGALRLPARTLVAVAEA